MPDASAWGAPEGEGRQPAHEANDRIVLRSDRLKFVSRVPFFCECGDPTCTEVVMLSRAEFTSLRSAHCPIIAAAHGSPNAH